MTLADIKDDFIFSFRHPRVRASIVWFSTSVLILLLVVVIYWWPISRSSNRLKDEVDNRQRVIAKAEYNLMLAKASDDAVQKMILIDKKLDASVSQAVLVQNMAMLARKNNVKIVSVAYEEGRIINGFVPLVNVLTIQAGYPEIRNFIAGLDQLPTLTIAQEAMLDRSANSTTIKAQLNIITYRREGGSNK